MRPPRRHGQAAASSPRARPRELIDAYSTREVLELRFDVVEHDEAGRGAALERASATGSRSCPTASCVYADDGDAAARRRHRSRPATASVARAALHAGGRLPPPHRPHPGRLTWRRPSSTAVTGTAAGPARHRPPAAPWRFVYEYQLRVYRRTWRGSLTTKVLTPVLFLLSMGVGLGSLVEQLGRRDRGRRQTVPYLLFVVPAILAVTCMSTGMGESIVAGARRDQVARHLPRDARDAAARRRHPAGPLRLRGHHGRCSPRRSSWSWRWRSAGSPRGPRSGACRSRSWSGWRSPRRSPRSPAGSRTTPASTCSSGSDQTPLFLFSGTFFPISQLPGWLQPVAWVTPLWHARRGGTRARARERQPRRRARPHRGARGVRRGRVGPRPPRPDLEAAAVSTSVASRLSRAVPIPAGAGLARMIVERNLTSFRHAWMTLVTGFAEPVFYLFSARDRARRAHQGRRPPTAARRFRMRCSSPPRCSPRRP